MFLWGAIRLLQALRVIMRNFYIVLFNTGAEGDRLQDTRLRAVPSREDAERIVRELFAREWYEFVENQLVEQYNEYVEEINLELREMMTEPRLYSQITNMRDAADSLKEELYDNGAITYGPDEYDMDRFRDSLPCAKQFMIEKVTLERKGGMEKAIFCLSDEGQYCGIHNPRKTWNGWANPALSLTSIQQLNEDWEQCDSPWRISYEDDSNEYFLINREEEYQSSPLPEIMFDDNTYIDLSGAGFCFDALDLSVEDLDADALHFLAQNHITCLEWAPEDMWHHLKKHLAEDFGLDKLRQEIADTVKGEDASSRTFLAWLIYNNRGITRKELGQALCAKNGRPYCRGYGSAFFNKTMPDSRTPCRGVLWDLIEAGDPSSGYELTQLGLETFILHELPEEAYRVEFTMHIGQFEDYQVHWFDIVTNTPSKEIKRFMDMFSATFDYLAVNDYHWALNMYNDQGGHVYHRSPDQGEHWNLNQEKEGAVWM